MRVNYNATGAERKSLVAAISQELNAPIKYLGAPTFAYEVGGYHIDKAGAVTGADVERLMEKLSGHGFSGEVELGETPVAQEPLANDVTESQRYQAELSDPDCPDRMEVFTADSDEDAVRQAREFCEGEIVLLELLLLNADYNVVRGVEITPDKLVLQMPLMGFTPEKLDNLAKLVNAKAALLKTALCTDDLPIRQTAETLDFPWFRFTEDSDTVNAYATLVSLLCKTAKGKKRVIAKERVHENPKYAMRCFLLSLGFIGDEYKASRKILLANLEGNSSWKSGSKTEVAGDE